MINLRNIKVFCESCGVKRIVETKPQEIHGINPQLVVPQTGKAFYLPRFCSVEMREAKAMNAIAEERLYENASYKIPNKGSLEDLKRLTSESEKDSYKRAVWINPKDKKVYYLLEEGRTKDGEIRIRILDQNIQFVKNAKLKPKEVYLTDMEKGLDATTEIDGMPFNHTDIIELLAKRYNPFANYKIRHFKNDEEFIQLKNEIGENKPIISASYGSYYIPQNEMKFGDKNNNETTDFINKERIKDTEKIRQTRELTKKSRLLASAGNDGKDYLSRLLVDTGIEGVGGLNYIGMRDTNSSSVNSFFTQHYEPYSFNVTKTECGINFSCLRGTDIAWDSDTPAGKSLARINGTSFSTPIRVAKLALNEMMKGIL